MYLINYEIQLKFFNPFYAAATSFDEFRWNLQGMLSRVKTEFQFFYFLFKGTEKKLVWSGRLPSIIVIFHSV